MPYWRMRWAFWLTVSSICRLVGANQILFLKKSVWPNTWATTNLLCSRELVSSRKA